MKLTRNYKTRKITKDTVLLEFPGGGSIKTDGRFIWVFLGKVKAPCGDYAENCLLRIDGLDKVDVSMVDVKTFFEPGFIDVKIGETA